MTDESHGMDPVEQPGTIEERDDTVFEGAGDFTSGEGLVAFAGIVLLGVWIVFDLILDTYGMDNLVPVVATVALILPRLDRVHVERVHPLPILMKVTGWALVFLGVVELLLDIRIGFYSHLGGIIGALAAYAGYVMAFLGARQIKI
jgi:hypothetical protein